MTGVFFQIANKKSTTETVSFESSINHKFFGNNMYADECLGVSDNLLVNADNEGFCLPVGQYIIEVRGIASTNVVTNDAICYDFQSTLTVNREARKANEFYGDIFTGSAKCKDFAITSGIVDITDSTHKISFSFTPALSTITAMGDYNPIKAPCYIKGLKYTIKSLYPTLVA
jgi:hypothetical protein